jgi:hypothetical protein
VATQPVPTRIPAIGVELQDSFPFMRPLAWDGDLLYASRGYSLFSAQMSAGHIHWRYAGRYRPAWWRDLTRRHRPSSRLVRDGFHALAKSGGNLIAAVPGAIATLKSGDDEFQIFHRLLRGTRPLHIAALPGGGAFWGEYFDNRAREEVYIYASSDAGLTWDIAYTFPSGSIRHIHNIIYDRWADRLWIFTGDYGKECRILCASTDLNSVDEVLSGTQQARAVAAVITQYGLYFASDSPLEQNHIYFLERRGVLRKLHSIPTSSIYACRNRNGIYFSTMVEPSDANLTQEAALFGSADGADWQTLASWRKDRWPIKLFQYGNVFLPDGENSTDQLAASAIAVEGADQQMLLWRTVLAPAPLD